MDDRYAKYLKALDDIASDLIRNGLYPPEDRLLREVVNNYARRRLAEEEKVVLGFEKQFISWEKFNDAIMNIATIEQEDIFFEWEAARDSVKACRKITADSA